MKESFSSVKIRIRLLEIAKDILIQESKESYLMVYASICLALGQALSIYYEKQLDYNERHLEREWDNADHDITSFFPELVILKPNRLYGEGAYWFPKNDFKSRIDLVNKAIESLKVN